MNNEEFVLRTAKSRELYARAQRVLPAGVSYRIRMFEPYPFYVYSAHGSKVVDIDGNSYTDYWCTHFSMILGHSHPRIKKALEKQLEEGWNFGLEHELEVRYAELIKSLVPGAEMIRFSNSGTEANMYATRLARTFTKRSLIGKFEGGWHGGYDALHCAVKPPFEILPSGGLVQGALSDTVVLPYNDIEGTRRTIGKRKLASIVVEPVLGVGGMIPADREFLKGLRELCDETGTLLLFDEVITGFRLGLGGGQGYFNVRPDITVLGKIIGGGLPIGAVSGRRDIMEHMDHTKYSGEDYCFQGGTGAANVLTLAAGEATIQALMDEPVYEKIDGLGQNLRTRLSETFSQSNFDARVTGAGSLFGIHFSKMKCIRDTRHLSGQHKEQAKQMFSYLLNNGILLLSPDLPHGAISYSHSESEIETLVSAIQNYVHRQTH
ncbi:aspartate aminotransferase family protein [Candidatus Bathyarchaeota archaeon]|nr:aspartate aminotransferase family protein [Candidatus Bathyarchaeota archaeon]